jgi:hypothetical protein
MQTLARIITYILVLAIIAVIVSQRSQSGSLIRAFTNTLAKVIGVAVGQSQPVAEPPINPAGGAGTPASVTQGIGSGPGGYT